MAICELKHFVNEVWYLRFCDFFSPHLQYIYNELLNDSKLIYYSNGFYHIKLLLLLLNNNTLLNLILSSKVLNAVYNRKLEIQEFWLYVIMHQNPGLYSIEMEECDFVYINDQWFICINKTGKSKFLIGRLCFHAKKLIKGSKLFYISFLAINKNKLNYNTHRDTLFCERLLLICLSFFLKQSYNRSFYYVKRNELLDIFNYVISSFRRKIFDFYVLNKKHLKLVNNLINKICR